MKTPSIYAGGLLSASFTLAALPALAQTVTVPTGTTQTISAAITDGSSANTLNVTGGGTLAVTNVSNSYSGGTNVSGNSTVQVGFDSELGAGTAPLTLGSGSTSGTLDVTPSTAVVTSARPITLGGTGGTIIANTNTWTFTGVVSGTGSLTITGTSGGIQLNGTNTYTGGTIVGGGSTLFVGTDANLGASGASVTLGDATKTGELALNDSASLTTNRPIILQSGGGIIDSGQFSWTFTSPITGPGSLSVGGGSAVILDGINTYTGGTTVTAGKLELGDATSPSAQILGATTVNAGTLSGRGTILGAVTNNGGTVAPGVDGIGGLTVGSYTQASGGTLAISLLRSGAAQLDVTGAAALAGNLTLNPLGPLHAGTYRLLSAASISGGFNNVTNQVSVGFDQNVTLNGSGTAYDLNLTQRTSIPENPSIYPALANTAIDSAQRANDTVISRLGDARMMATLDHMVIASDRRHIIDDWGCAGCSPYGGWFKATGGFGTTDGSGGTPGYNSNTEGFLTGVDGAAGDDTPFVFGVTFGYDHSAVDENGGAHGTISTPRLMAYGDWWHGRYAVDVAAGGGYASFSGSRPITQTGASASSNAGGLQFTSSVQGSAMFAISSFVITPAIGMKFARQDEHAFTETRGGAYDLNGQSSSANSLRPFVSCTTATRFDAGTSTRIEPTLRVAYAEEALGRPGIDVNPTADDYTFPYPGIRPSRGQVSVNAGATIERTRALNFFTDAGLVSAGNTRGAQFNAGVRYMF
jgi:fibronectin-binding autotransporter adhesin